MQHRASRTTAAVRRAVQKAAFPSFEGSERYSCACDIQHLAEDAWFFTRGLIRDPSASWTFDPTHPSAQLDVAAGCRHHRVGGNGRFLAGQATKGRSDRLERRWPVRATAFPEPRCTVVRLWSYQSRRRSSDANCGRCIRRCCIVQAFTDNATVHKGVCRGGD